ncbi:MAG: ABC transporter permease [Streptosporangiaceae bacterium]
MNLLSHTARFLVDNPHVLLTAAASQLLLSAVAVAVAVAISLPIGLITGHLHRGAFLAISGGNVARALPTLAIIAVGITLWGIGFLNIMIALVVLAIPPILTNTYVAVANVDPAMAEAARGMGMRSFQVLTRVELPAAGSLIIGGIRTASVYVIATAYLASFAGTNSTLGLIITDEGYYGLAGVLAATLVVVVMAFAIEALLALCQRLLTPHGVRLLRAAAAAEAAAA